jgi:hypothetical protein
LIGIASKATAYALGAALLASLAWGGWQWRGKVSARQTLAEARAGHAEVLRDIADKTAETARLAGLAQNAYHEKVQSDALAYEQKEEAAYERGRQHGAAIAAGTERVRTVWRERECPQADAGQGPESGDGRSGVAPGRAAAIGAVLGLGGAFDAGYDLAYGRLKAAQGLLNACYDEPATGDTP